MNVLIVYAHPESRSLSAALRDVAIAELTAEGHSVELSDLHAMGWKAVVDRADFPALGPGTRLRVPSASGQAVATATLTDDVAAEQEKMRRADLLILQFPLWWFAMPAILKGWVDRVYAHGFAYGVGEHSDRRWGNRYGEGTFVGKRAMLIVTAGGWEPHYSARGINGPIEDLLFPIHHGILHYPGYDVLPPFVVYRADRLDQVGFDHVAEGLRQRMRTLDSLRPIPFRCQNGGDYLIPELELRAELGAPGATGFALHLKTEDGRDPSDRDPSR
ncbi:NAD(P)H-dependent oxidoreductase (plasmid) [Cereibacter azotoformans]|uniref:NAD(P)H-dependent oxidoreductase n=1 Tax=Cereibacter TaxID=1653176 RepID=UPI0011A3C1B4|nr:NAD(P)H-dependent oxidoreductase [Cereibacter sediminicola]